MLRCYAANAENTTVENGTLLVNGRQDNHLNTTQVTVTSGGTLGGTGILQGPTSVSGNLRPGSHGIGLLIFENSLNLLGGALTTLEIDGVTARGTSYDAINVTLPNGLAFGGELELVFTGAAELGNYKLFDFAGNSSGGLGSVTLAGSHAGSLSQTGAGVWSGNAGGLGFTFQRNKEAAYLNPTAEFSANLTIPWTTAVHGTNATITVTDAGASETVTVTIQKNGAPTLFARLKVVEPLP